MTGQPTLPEKLVTSYRKTIHFKQKMTGTTNIITKDLRLAERSFYQLRDILGR